MKSTIVWFVCAVCSGVLIAGCAGGTRLTPTSMDETYRGKPVSNILVIGVTFKEKEEVRRSFEDRFVAQLKAAGVEAIASGDAISIPGDLMLKKDAILQAVNKFNNDAVIITHLIGKEEKEVYSRSNRGPSGYYSYYGWAYGHSHSPDHFSANTTVRLATNLYDVKTEKRIWSAESETLKAGSVDQVIDDVIKLVIDDLQINGLLPKN